MITRKIRYYFANWQCITIWPLFDIIPECTIFERFVICCFQNAIEFYVPSAAYAADFLSINRYFGWYTDTGNLDIVTRAFENDIRAWNQLVSALYQLRSESYGDAETRHQVNTSPMCSKRVSIITSQNLSSLSSTYFFQHNKPVIVTEYGGDTINGFHEIPSTIFTEEYQAGETQSRKRKKYISIDWNDKLHF